MKVLKFNIGTANESVNFIDENDVYIGYDMGKDSCKDDDWFGWFISDSINKESIPEDRQNDSNINDFVFDPLFFMEVENTSLLEEGKMAIFRLTSGESEKYLHLFNVHNGYYCHDIVVKHSGETVKDDCL